MAFGIFSKNKNYQQNDDSGKVASLFKKIRLNVNQTSSKTINRDFNSEPSFGQVNQNFSSIDPAQQNANHNVNSQEQFVITTDGIQLKSANNSFLNFFNVKDIEEFVNRYGNCICDSFHKDDTNGFIQKNINGEDWIDYINARKELIHKAKIIKDNKTYIFSITVDKFLFKNELLYAAVFSDITQLENNIKINEETNFFLTQLLNSIPNPIFYKNEFGVFTGFNKAYEKTFNVKKEDLIGKTVLDLEYLPYEDRIMYHNEDMKIIENLSSVEKEQNMTFADNKIHTTLYFVNSYTKEIIHQEA